MRQSPYNILPFCLALLLCVFISHPTNAKEEPKHYDNDTILTDDATARFIDSIDEVEVLADHMVEKGAGDMLRVEETIQKSQNFAPYRTYLDMMEEEHPEDYAKLGEIVAKYGFESQLEWAKTGDAVMLAYMNLQQDKNKMNIRQEMQAQLTPEMMAMMPPSAKAQIDKALAMADAINDVPQENVDIVRSHKAALEVAMRENLRQ